MNMTHLTHAVTAYLDRLDITADQPIAVGGVLVERSKGIEQLMAMVDVLGMRVVAVTKTMSPPVTHVDMCRTTADAASMVNEMLAFESRVLVGGFHLESGAPVKLL